MISETYKIREFLKTVDDLDYYDIISTARRECREAEDRSYGGVKGAVKAREMGAPEYANELKQFIHFLETEIQGDVSPRKENPLYRPVVESLVRRKQVKPVVLEIFDDPSQQ